MVLRRQTTRFAADYCSSILYLYGYGTGSQNCAWYGLEFFRLWLEPMLRFDLHLAIKGYPRLWETIVTQLGVPVALGRRVRRLEPDAAGVICSTADGEEKRFDFVVNSVPHKVVVRSSEVDFDRVQEHPYLVGVADVRGMSHPTEMNLVDLPGEPNLLVAQGRIRTGEPRDPAPAAFYCAPDLRGPTRPAPDAFELDRIVDNIRRRFGHDAAVSAHRTWSYHPRFPDQEIRAGAPARVWGSQGRGRIWNTGGACCFESVPNICDYNRRLVQTAGI